jgi:hypothetical protein
MLNAQEFVDLANDYYNNLGQPIPAIISDPSLQTPNDWQDQIFQKGMFSNYQIGATGGTDRIRYSVSGGYSNQEGIIKRTSYERYNFRLNMEADLSKKLKVGTSLLPNYSIQQTQPTTGPSNQIGLGGILSEALNLPPIVPVFRPDGDYLVIPRDPELVKYFNTQVYNPVNKIDANNEFNRAFRFTGNTFAEFEVFKGLRLRSAFNLGVTNERYEQYVAPFISYRGNDAGNISTPNFGAITASRHNNTFTNWYISNTAAYSKTIGSNHNLSALLGYDAAKQNDYSVSLFPRTDRDNPLRLQQ